MFRWPRWNSRALLEVRFPRGLRLRANSGNERRLQKALVRWKDPANRRLVEEALTTAGRTDLLGRFRAALHGGGGGARRPSPRTGARSDAGTNADGDETLDLDTCG